MDEDEVERLRDELFEAKAVLVSIQAEAQNNVRRAQQEANLARSQVNQLQKQLQAAQNVTNATNITPPAALAPPVTQQVVYLPPVVQRQPRKALIVSNHVGNDAILDAHPALLTKFPLSDVHIYLSQQFDKRKYLYNVLHDTENLPRPRKRSTIRYKNPQESDTPTPFAFDPPTTWQKENLMHWKQSLQQMAIDPSHPDTVHALKMLHLLQIPCPEQLSTIFCNATNALIGTDKRRIIDESYNEKMKASEEWIINTLPLLPLNRTMLAVVLDIMDSNVSYTLKTQAVGFLQRMPTDSLVLCMANTQSGREWKRSPSAIGSVVLNFYRCAREEQDQRFLDQSVHFLDRFRHTTSFRTHLQEFRIFFQAAASHLLDKVDDDIRKLLQLQLDEINREEMSL